jgi:hypothetical protein
LVLLPDVQRQSAAFGVGTVRLAAARWVSLALSLAVAAWLGYAFGRGQSLAEVARLYADVGQLQYTVDSGQMVAHFARTGGALKPLLQAHDGTPLMDYSDWDYQSVVLVDGQRFELVRLNPSDSIDYARNRIVEGLNSGQWILSREITINGSQATVAFTLLTNKPVHEVRLTIAHNNWYYLEVTPGPDGFTATLPRASRGEIEAGLATTPQYEVTLSAATAGRPLPDMVQVGSMTPFGIASVVMQYQLQDPPVGDYVPVATETVRWRTLP